MLQLRVIGPADQIETFSRALAALSGLVVEKSSGVLPSRTPGAVRQYLTVLPTPTVERS